MTLVRSEHANDRSLSTLRSQTGEDGQTRDTPLPRKAVLFYLNYASSRNRILRAQIAVAPMTLVFLRTYT
jgi:hypothetical protein